MLPLQLIFAGKTERSRPAATAASTAAGFHLTSSENHWSTQQTMREYIEHVIEPYRQRKVKEKGLKHDSRMVLVLDAWSVHRSEEFRTWMAKNHPLMHLVFVPANCTSHLQVACNRETSVSTSSMHACNVSQRVSAATERFV